MSESKHASFIRSLFSEQEEPRRKIYHSIKAKINARRTYMEKMADIMTSKFGSNVFLLANLVLFIIWILINAKIFKLVPVFDPFPYSLLTTIVSLEAIILSIFVLISQNRTSKVDDLREEIHLQLNIIAEREITKLIKMTSLLLEKHGIDLSKDPELKKMIHPVNEAEIQRQLEKEIL